MIRRGARSFGAPLSCFSDVAGARVAVVTTSFPAYPGDPSGHFVAAHVAALTDVCREVTVIAPAPIATALPPSVRTVAVGGESLFGWPGAVARARRAPWRLLALPAFVSRARAALVDAAPDVIVAHWAVPSAFPVCDGIDGALEVWWHGADVRALVRLPRAASAAVLERILLRARRLIFVADALRRAARDRVPDRHLPRFDAIASTCPAPIDVVPVEGLPPLPAPCRAPYVVWCGRDVAAKRLELAIGATARAGLRLVVVGVTRRSAGVDDAHVVWLGIIPRPAALAVIAGASKLLSTSSTEGAPTVVREARAYGVPVVATEAGDLAAWAAEDEGIVVASANVADLASALLG